MKVTPIYRCSLEAMLQTKLPGTPGKRTHAISALQVVRNRRIPVTLVIDDSYEKPVSVVVSSTDYEIERFACHDDAKGFVDLHELILN